MKPEINLYWFRQDLRLTDNPALSAALQQGNVLAIYILDDDSNKAQPIGAASRTWLHHSLLKLNQSLNGMLNLYKGNATDILADLHERFQIKSVYWNRCYEPWRISRDKTLKASFELQAIPVYSFNASLLQEPWTILKADNSPYKVFTPYHRKAIELTTPQSRKPFPLLEQQIKSNVIYDQASSNISELALLPKLAWDKGFYELWDPGEQGAQEAINGFLLSTINDYQQGRDYPAINSISRISPHLHFGEISPRQIIDKLQYLEYDHNIEHYIRELNWREFSYYLLFHWPQIVNENLKPSFNQFPWQNNANHLAKWQQGQTGYPLVDAAMRELWQTGFMHNRMRMLTASFLTKNLLIDWRLGADWFWDCLLDADLASNSASWQWVAGCGTDAAPYFRIFNPITQGEKFDPQGTYTKQYVPELKELPNEYLFKPWLAPKSILEQANIKLGEHYPLPIVDIKTSREQALQAYEVTKRQFQQH